MAPCSTLLAIISWDLSKACLEINGPKSLLESNPEPTCNSFAALIKSGIQSLVSPTVTNTLAAIQRCPAAPAKAPTIEFINCALFASGTTTTWFLAAKLA